VMSKDAEPEKDPRMRRETWQKTKAATCPP